MKIGYPCMNRSLGCSSSSTFRLKSFTEERFLATVESNLRCLRTVLEYNLAHGLLFFRITSDLIPFASHPVCTVPWQRIFRGEFASLGRYIRENGMRISMHPDQFTLINAADEGIVGRSFAELRYHADVLDCLELDTTARIQVHVGGVYGDKPASMERFAANWRRLDEAVRRRLVVENDERSYGVEDCLAIHGRTGVPVLFDNFHYEVYSGTGGVAAAFRKCAATWKGEDGLPMVDYSLQKEGARPGAHADSIDAGRFAAFIASIAPLDADIMLEIKDKEASALKAVAAVAGDPRLVAAPAAR